MYWSTRQRTLTCEAMTKCPCMNRPRTFFSWITRLLDDMFHGRWVPERCVPELCVPTPTGQEHPAWLRHSDASSAPCSDATFDAGGIVPSQRTSRLSLGYFKVIWERTVRTRGHILHRRCLQRDEEPRKNVRGRYMRGRFVTSLGCLHIKKGSIQKSKHTCRGKNTSQRNFMRWSTEQKLNI